MKPIFITIFWYVTWSTSFWTEPAGSTFSTLLIGFDFWREFYSQSWPSSYCFSYCMMFVTLSFQFSSPHNGSGFGQPTIQGRITRFSLIISNTAMSLLTLNKMSFSRMSITMSNSQVKRTYETTQGIALAHHHLPSLGPIKCFGLLQTLVLRLLLSTVYRCSSSQAVHI